MKIKRLVFLFLGLNLLIQMNAFPNSLPKICMILDKAGKDDHGFNQEAYKGFQNELKLKSISSESRVFEAKDDAQIEQATRSFVNGNCALIFAIGVNVAEPLKKFAKKYPNQKFVMIDYLLKADNVQSVLFREDQVGFLVGAIAAMKSTTQKIGMIAGMDIPLIQRFKVGYEAGAKYINPNIKVVTSFISVSVDGWNNPTKSEEIALSQYNLGVDIIFQASGGSGVGVFDAAEKMNMMHNNSKYYAIGCDSNQNWIKPGIILTSAIKNIGLTVENSIHDINKQIFNAGVFEYGVKNNGVNWTLDKYNEIYFSKEDLAKIEKIKHDIGSGKIVVPDYYKIR